MKTYNEMKLDNLSEEELINELSLGSISSKVLLGRIVVLTRQLEDKNLGKVLQFMSYLIFVVSLKIFRKNKKESNNKSRRRNIVWKHLNNYDKTRTSNRQIIIRRKTTTSITLKRTRQTCLSNCERES